MEEKARIKYGIKIRKVQDRFADNIIYLRTLREYTIADLSNRTGLSASYLSELESGKKRKPTIETIACLGEALEISPGALLDVNFRAEALRNIQKIDESKRIHS